MRDDMNVSTRSLEINGNGGTIRARIGRKRCYSPWWAHVTDDCRTDATMQEKVEFFRPLFKPRSKPVTFRREHPGEVVYIPPLMASREFSKFKMSARLRNVLGFNNYWLLGDLDGIAYDDLLKLRNCGKVSVTELRRLVKRIQNEAKFLSSHPAAADLAFEYDDSSR